MSISLELLTDEAILDYTKSEAGVDRVLTNHKDLNLNFARVEPVRGGIFDTDIFGSPFEDSCVCASGGITRPSPEPCPGCNARILTRDEALRRFARIELPFYYLSELRFDIFKECFDDIFSSTKVKLDFTGNDFKNGGYSGRGGKKMGLKTFDTCQFNYDPDRGELVVSQFITDKAKCSYEGILKIVEEHFPGRLVEFKKLINKYYLVNPAVMRPFTLGTNKNGKKKEMGTHKLNVWYSAIISLCCAEATDKNPHNFNDVISRFNTDGEKVRYIALLRAFLNAGKKDATELLNSSKKNLARNLYSVRTKVSARCPIVPATELAIDEISLPIHIAYEMCREDFIKYLQEELNFTRREARISTKEEYNNPETLRLFREYAEKQIVLALTWSDGIQGLLVR